MSKDSHLLKIARDCSLQSDYSGKAKVHIGCVIGYKGTILAKGWNSDKTHTEQEKNNRWRYKDSGNNYLPAKLHSEIAALQKIKYLDIDFSKVKVYVYREYKNGRPALARPCPSCMAAIRQLGINTIVYTTPDGVAKETLA